MSSGNKLAPRLLALTSHSLDKFSVQYKLAGIGKLIAVRMGWRSLIAFLLPFFVYLITLAPTVYNLDSAELSTAAATGGLMRSTGYPLYLTIGYFWSKLPLGDVGYRMNLFSAVCGAMTILLAERILRRWKIGNWATFAALGLLSVSTYYWGLSLVAEVYTLHTAIMAGFILALLRWSDHPIPKRIFWVGLLGGLGLTHHAAMVLLGPASLLFVMLSHPRKILDSRTVAATVAGLLVGLSPYLYLPLRYLSQPVFNYAGNYDAALQFYPIDLASLNGLVWLITGRSFAGAMMAYHGLEIWRETQSFLVQLGRAFFAIGIGPGLLGIVLLLRRNWREGLLLTIMFAFTAGFYVNYQVMDKDTMFLPAYLVWALWMGIGCQWLIDWLELVDRDKIRRYTVISMKGLLAGFVLFALVWNWRIVDLSSDRSTRERGEAILQQADANAIIFGWWDTVPVVQYLQLVEGMRPDVKAINRFLISEQDLVSAIQKEVNIRPVYIDSVPKSITTKLSARPEGPIYRLKARTSAVEVQGKDSENGPHDGQNVQQ
jgi:hypothetical protein